jgi:hypothetical protein
MLNFKVLTFLTARGDNRLSFRYLNTFFLLFLLFPPAHSQLSVQIPVAESLEEYSRLNQAPPGQKIYLHLDRFNYMQGDTIWFKAYTWYGYDQLPDTLNAVLHVELLDPSGKTRLTRKLLIFKGISHGEFCLDTTISPGNYTIRAYTRWMGNQNTGEPFYQKITISPADQIFLADCTPVILKQAGSDSLKVSFRFNEIDKEGNLKNKFSQKVNYSLNMGGQLLDTGQMLAENSMEHILKYSLADIGEKEATAVFELSIRDEKLNFSKKFRIPVSENIDIQFFPEGGKLVNGLPCKLAFKAIGTDGLSREVEGVIETEDGEFVTGLESSHKGMGAFMLKPIPGKKYFARVLFNNRKYLIPLPAASESGCAMSVSFPENGKDPYLTLRYSSSEKATQKYLAVSAYGTVWFTGIIKEAMDSIRVRIPLELLPEGVCILTVLNGDFKPECERLFFVDKKKQFNIDVIPDSSSYSTRSKVTLLIKTSGKDGFPLMTDLSLSVVDKEQVTENVKVNGISAYKLLESELKGYIEDAGFYFRNDSSVDNSSLDLLLLTQGYRKFLPGNPNPEAQKFQPERSFSISGNIKLNGSKTREAKFNYKDVSLIFSCNTGEPTLGLFNTDSLGHFKIELPLLYGKAHSILQTNNLKGKPLECRITLDDPAPEPVFAKPLMESYHLATPLIESVTQLQAVKKTEISRNPVYGEMSLTLPEITVKAKSKNWYLDFAANAEKIADLDLLDPKGSKYKNLCDLLVKEFGAREYFEPKISRYMAKFPIISLNKDFGVPIYLVNGTVLFSGFAYKGELALALTQVADFPVNEIKKIMVLPPGQITAYYASPYILAQAWQSMVVIETYTNKFYRGDPKGIITFMVDGLDFSREFYSPRYDGPSKKNQIYDSRATLYWNPSLKTDENGLAKIDFFTSDRKTSLAVVINGIEAGSGNPGQKQIIINSASK